MIAAEIQFLVDHRRYPGAKAPATLIETHISWVILTPELVYKIKKPVQFSFLDFSTLEKRKFYCAEEVRLNQRLAPAMYLNVVPIRRTDHDQPAIGATSGKTVDYAVQMKRMDNSRQMDQLLQRNAVTTEHLRTLATVLARFHQSVVLDPVATGYQSDANRADFEDLFLLEKQCTQLFGPNAANELAAWRSQITHFLALHEPRLRARAQAGYWVEGHGDLHGRNIFLLPEGPIVFDCIEFNPHFRKLDVLNELAFLCMELDAGGHHALEKTFMEAYLQNWNCINNAEDRRLFHYFKTYRANVRLKVTLLEWQQHHTPQLEKTAGVYWRLLTDYMHLFATAQ